MLPKPSIGKSERIKAKLLFTANENEVCITATDEDSIKVTLKEDYVAEPAKNEKAALQTLLDNLSKSGDSIFAFTPVILSDKVYFFPHAVINTWRRKIAEKLEEVRLAGYVKEERIIEPNSFPYPAKSLGYYGNVSNSLARKFYVRHGVESIDEAFELSPDTNGILMTTHYCIRRELGICNKGKVAGNAESLYLYNNGKRLRVDFDCTRCGMTIRNIKYQECSLKI